jgi:SAM-dependent methyltransferase
MAAAWNPAMYMKNAGPRLRPALDLLQRTVAMTMLPHEPATFTNANAPAFAPIPADAVRSVLDLGCGPGNVTPYLRQVGEEGGGKREEWSEWVNTTWRGVSNVDPAYLPVRKNI